MVADLFYISALKKGWMEVVGDASSTDVMIGCWYSLSLLNMAARVSRDGDGVRRMRI